MIADNDSDGVLRAVLVLMIETLLQMSGVVLFFFNAEQLREYIPFIC